MSRSSSLPKSGWSFRSTRHSDSLVPALSLSSSSSQSHHIAPSHQPVPQAQKLAKHCQENPATYCVQGWSCRGHNTKLTCRLEVQCIPYRPILAK